MAAEEGPTALTLEKHLRRCEETYLQMPLENYILASSFGIRNYHGQKSARINGVKISFSDALPPKFDRSAIKEKIEDNLPESSANILQVLARVSARTEIAAFEEARNNLDLLRAVWCFTLQFRNFILFSVGARKPVNTILPGPLHTLHRPRGTLATEVFWYEPEGLQDKHIYNADQQWQLVEKGTARILARLRAIKYRRDLEWALIVYVRALDTRNHANAFADLWSVLELLTNSVGNYDQLIKRAAFLHGQKDQKDRLFAFLLLEHLRDVRNQLVHSQAVRSNVEVYLYQLKGIVEIVLRYHLIRGRAYSSLAGAAEFLDTPVDRNILKRRIRDYKRALRDRK